MPKLIAMAALVTLGTLAFAPNSAHAQSTIFACKNKSDGTLRIVASGTTCKNNETLISWPSVDTNTLGNLSCSSGQIPKFNGSQWVCSNISDDDTLGDLTCSAGQSVKFNGTAWVCDPPRLEIRSHTSNVQTVYDNQTGLEWEMKVTCGGADLNKPHCVENSYQWSTDFVNANGALFTDFLVKLNASIGSVSLNGNNLDPDGCYAGHCDWRVPNIVELQTILIPQFLCNTIPCIDPIFGPTIPNNYWTSSVGTVNPVGAWFLGFHDGKADTGSKNDALRARAVRGGR
jgi:hypothetical protein